jgi:flagellar hook-associated protein 3 FlgL
MTSAAFRITQRSVAATAMGGLSDNLARLSRIQERLASGRQIGRPSDSPSGAISALRLRSDLRKADQYQRASDDGIGWLSTADVALSDGIGLVRHARELVLRGANDALTPSDRVALATEVEGLREALLSVANTSYLGRPIFAGTEVTPAAYDTTGAYQGNNGSVNRTVGPGMTAAVNLAGNDLFSALTEVADHLRNDPDALQGDLTALDNAFLRIQHALSTVGSRYHQIEIMQQRTETNRLATTNQLSEVEGVDLPATVVELQLAEVAYQAALGATAKAIQPSLLDFLR